MTFKLLLPAYGKHGCAIVGTGGKLRTVDRPKRICHGYSTGCVCPNCLQRVRRKARAEAKAGAPKRCECDRPLAGAESRCEKCGREIRRIAA